MEKNAVDTPSEPSCERVAIHEPFEVEHFQRLGGRDRRDEPEAAAGHQEDVREECGPKHGAHGGDYQQPCSCEESVPLCEHRQEASE